MKKEKEESVTIVMYHYVRPIKNSKFPRIKGLEFELFKLQLDYLQKNFNMIAASDLIDYFDLGKKLPKNSCLLTFDDGYKDHILFVLPELLKRKIKAIFFPIAEAVLNRKLLDVNAIHFILEAFEDHSLLLKKILKSCLDNSIELKILNDWKKNQMLSNNKYDKPETSLIKKMLQYLLPVEIRKNIISQLFKEHVSKESNDFASSLYLNADDIRAMLNFGMQIGSHGFAHIRLGQHSCAEQKKEIENSLNFLESFGIAKKNWVMSYPYGNYNNDTLSILDDLNCSMAFVDYGGKAVLNKKKRFELTRHDTNDFLNKSNILK
jgi:peptidoglycan/xylan/chitin deacetylase (PgdA/CDA1 family)